MKAMKILVFRASRRSSTTINSTGTRLSSWVHLSVTSVPLPSPFPAPPLTPLQTGEIKALAGVDFLTISPNLLEELKSSTTEVPKKLNAEALSASSIKDEDKIPKVTYVDNEPEFRWALLQDAMAFDKLHEGIKKFAEDGQTLKSLLRKKLEA
jgi:hypothetical protein